MRDIGRNNQKNFCVCQDRAYHYYCRCTFSISPFFVCLSWVVLLSYVTVKATLFIFSKQGRLGLFFAWQCRVSLPKHTWLANDNLSSDMSRNLVSQNSVLRERSDQVGEDVNDRKRWGQCSPLLFRLHPTRLWQDMPVACDKVKLSPLGWHTSRRHFEVNTSQGMWLWDLDSGLTSWSEALFSLK